MRKVTSRVLFGLANVMLIAACWAAPAHGEEGHGEEGEEQKAEVVTYMDDVAPILRQNCFTCHNPNKKSGDLDLTNYTNLMQGGASGTVIEPGDASSSYLYMLITHESEPNMPPESPKLPDAALETVRKWIDGGVLETKSSRAQIKKKNNVAIAMQGNSNERPEVVPMPARLSLQPVIHTEDTTAVTALATSPWAPLVAVAGQQQVLIYNAESLQLCAVLPFPEGVPQVLKFSRNGSLLLAGGGRGGASGRVVVWNVESGERVIQVGDELDTVLAADISSDQTLIALGGPQRVVRIYSTETGELLHELRKHTDWVCSLEFSPDSVLLATGDRSGGLYVWEAWTGREYLTLKAHSANVTCVSWRSDSNILASCSEDGSVRLWEMENGNQVKNWGGHGGGVASIEFTRDGRLVSCGRDRTVKLWDQAGKQERGFEAFSDLALRVTYCDETKRVIAGDWNGTVRVWNAENGESVGTLSTNPLPLHQRRKSVAEQLAALEQQYAPLQAALEAAESGLQQVQLEVAAAEQFMERAKSEANDITKQFADIQSKRDQQRQEFEALQRQTKQWQEGIAALETAIKTTQEAVAKLPEDQELQTAVTSLKAARDARLAQLSDGAKSLEESNARLQGYGEELDALKARTEQVTASATEATKQWEAASVKLADAQRVVAEAQQAAAPVAAELEKVRAALVRWEDEIAFAEQLAQLVDERSGIQEQFSAQEEQFAELAEARDKARMLLDAAEQEATRAADQATAAKAAAEAAATQVSQHRAAMDDAEAARQAKVAQATTLEAVLVPLREASESAEQAASRSNGDQELSQVAGGLKALVARKQAALAAAQNDLQAHTAEADQSKQQLVALEQAAAQAAAAVTDAETQAAERIVAKQSLDAKFQAAQQAAEAAQAALDALQKELERVDHQIDAAKGIATG